MNDIQSHTGRIIWIDQLRALCIFFMLLGHTAVPKSVNNLIYSFHMPLFFMISGMTLDFQRLMQTDFKSIFLKRFKAYIIPYLFLNFMSFPFYWFVKSFLRGVPLDAPSLLLGIVVGNYRSGFEHPAGPSWFLLTLFLAHMVFWGLVRISKGQSCMMLCLCSVCALWGFAEKGLPLPWHFGTMFSAVMFLLLGNCMRSAAERLCQKISGGGDWILVLVLFACGVVLSLVNGRISMHANKFGRSLSLYYLTPCATGLSLVLIMMRVPAVRILEFIGRNTLLYMGASSLFIAMINELVIPGSVSGNPAVQTALAVFLFFAHVPLVLLVNKFFPFICGKRFEGFPPRFKFLSEFLACLWGSAVPVYLLLGNAVLTAVVTLTASALFVLASQKWFRWLWCD